MSKKKIQTANSFFDDRKRLILIVLTITIVVRTVIVTQWNASVFNLAIWSDSATYNQWARNIVVTGDWIGTKPFFMTPFYPYFLAVIYSIVGESIHAVRIIQNAIGVAIVLLIFLSAEKIFNRRAAFFSALLASLYGPLYLHANLLLVETVKVFFLILSFHLLLVAQEKKNHRWWFFAGLSLGGAILCRPTDILTLLFVILWVFSVNDQKSSNRIRTIAFLIIPIILIVLPVTIRNYMLSEEFIPITSNGGLNLYLGNNPKAVGVYYNVDGLDLANDPDGRVFLETKFGRQITPGEASSYWTREAAMFMREHPGDFIGLLAKKALLIFHYKEISQLGYNYNFISKNAVPFFAFLLTFVVILPFALIGMFATRKNFKKYIILYGYFGAQCSAVILFFVTDRYRLSIIPFFILFAGIGIDWLIDRWNNNDRTKLGFAFVIMVTAVGISTEFNMRIDDEFSIEHEYIGLNYFEMKRYDLAMYEYEQAIRSKESFHIRNNIGNVYSALGNVPAAMKEYQRGNELNPRQAISLFSMGTAYVRAQRFDSALIYFERAKLINPRFAPVYLNAGLSYWYMGNFTEALGNLERYVSMESDREKVLSVQRDIENLKRMIAESR